MKVTIAGLDVQIERHRILNGVDVAVSSGQFHGLIGPNGSGKSTLLRCVYRSLRPTAGAVTLDDKDLWRELSPRQAARSRAVVAQDNAVDLDFTVRDVVAMDARRTSGCSSVTTTPTPRWCPLLSTT